MQNQRNPVVAGLTEGLRPEDLRPDVARPLIVDIELLASAERLRVVQAVERQVDLGEHHLALQARIAKAAERQADAMESIGALLASMTGRGRSACAPGDSTSPWDTAAVNYLRVGDGNRNFGCDVADGASDE